MARSKKVYDRLNGHCGYCGVLLSPFERWHEDHIIPLSKGGTDSFENRVAACAPCNRRKTAFTIDEFKQSIRNRVLNAFDGFYADYVYLDRSQRLLIEEHIEAIKSIVSAMAIEFPVEELQRDLICRNNPAVTL